jgi:hypothetical protein
MEENFSQWKSVQTKQHENYIKNESTQQPDEKTFFGNCVFNKDTLNNLFSIPSNLK